MTPWLWCSLRIARGPGFRKAQPAEPGGLRALTAAMADDDDGGGSTTSQISDQVALLASSLTLLPSTLVYSGLYLGSSAVDVSHPSMHGGLRALN
jgi:hypothetical protein